MREKTIFKYKLQILDEYRLVMPRGAKILRVGCQSSNEIVLWAIVDPQATPITRKIFVLGTGHPFEYKHELAEYIGTVQHLVDDETYVWHFFDGGEI